MDSPYINHFLSTDTIIPDPSNPQSWNRYSYVINNPLRYTDPTGHSQCQTQDECDDMGTTPRGTGGSNNKPKPKKDGGHHDDDSLLDPNPNGVTLPIPTMENNLQADDSSNNFWAVASAFGDIAFGGFFTSLSVYALVASCVYAGPACLITAPIFFTTAVIGAQVFVNGVQSLRQMNDSSIEPTGREVIDLVFPFLKEKR